jgi:hydroxymethylbilane synthase
LKLRLGTRASPLATWQANWVATQLTHRGASVELVPISTTGDRDRESRIGDTGQTGVFTKELQKALLAEQIDLAVHSLKDLPTETVDGLALAAVPPRGPIADVLVGREAVDLVTLPRGARIGTGSLRRQAQLRHLRPDVEVSTIRGNVETRLRKLADGEFDAIVLAEAGLTRLGFHDLAMSPLAPPVFWPAPGQGALGIETRAVDSTTLAAVAGLNDADSRAAVLAERSVLARLQGGCLAPIAAWGRCSDGNRLVLTAVVVSADGRRRLIAESEGETDSAERLGAEVARELIELGAEALIDQSRDRDAKS